MPAKQNKNNPFIQPVLGEWSRKRLQVIGARTFAVKKKKVNSKKAIERHRKSLAERTRRIKSIGAGHHTLDRVIMDVYQKTKGKVTSRIELWRACMKKGVFDGAILTIRIGVLAEANKLKEISFNAHMARYRKMHKQTWNESAKVTAVNFGKKLKAQKRKPKPGDLTFGRSDVTHTIRTFGE